MTNSNSISIGLMGTDNDKGGGKPYDSSKPFGRLPATNSADESFTNIDETVQGYNTSRSRRSFI